MKVVVHWTGLSPHVIRVWEKRYGAVSPRRTSTNRRLYSEADIKRLMLLRQATLVGHSIGHIATLPSEQLRHLVGQEAMPPPVSTTPLNPDPPLTQAYLAACLAAIEHLAAGDLEATLMRARVAFSRSVFIEALIGPLMAIIGERWQDGSFRIVHEHLASAVVRTLLGDLVTTMDISSLAPTLIVATLSGQRHEIGALIVASTAASAGWRVVYLGPDLPAVEIAAAAQQKHAAAIALSFIHPADDPRVGYELTTLRRYLSQEVELIVGGRAAASYRGVLEAVGALRLPDMPRLRTHLETLRTR